ncbi:MAG: preprotein translocase subunit SecA [Ardenticatenia bacterium]|nr:preprotein translocase subunit SecA [Ardenticatenia bacterium]
MLKNVLTKVLGDPNQKTIDRLTPLVEEVNALEADMQRRSNDELRQMMADFRANIAQATSSLRSQLEESRSQRDVASGDERRRREVEVERLERDLLKLEESLMQDMMPPVFAAVREASVRATGLRHYDVQVVGGAILHLGNVVEMRTGEGKTLVATMPVMLNALAGRGAHLVTVNDYLAKRDTQWMGPIYHLLGMSVGVIQSAGGGHPDAGSYTFDPDFQAADDRYLYLRPVSRRQAYHCDITYGTNNEFGFDYLRDNMVYDLSQLGQRELHYAIIDEVDNILIDEARTPLIISGAAEESSSLYREFAGVVRQLKPSSHASVEAKAPDGDYSVDEKARVVTLTESGVEKVERVQGIDNLYGPEHWEKTPYLDNALRAHVLYQRDHDYLVKDGQVIIVDEFTGRMMIGRRYSEGLHQAIEAKENVAVQRESLTLATVTFQNFFRMYNKLAGMTGTAATEAEEFGKIYDLEVSVLPTNIEYRAMQGELETATSRENGVETTTYNNLDTGEHYCKRVDYADQIHKSPQAKFKAVAEEIAQTQAQGRPVLVGTVAIETSEHLSGLLKRKGVPHEVLNAKHHEREALIITQAGVPGAVTIATNMAGRGVDILLGGNPEGTARDQLRKEEVDLTEIPSAAWNEAVEMLRAGEDPTDKYPTRWAEVLAEQYAICQQNRDRVVERGGLHVVGTERHDARRIDNQLRGRAGRQGDPGSSRFYLSLQDDLMRRFGGQRVAGLMETLGVEDDIPIEAGLVSKSIESAQTRVEGYNFDIRKHLLEYDNVVNQQREVIYAQRRRILSSQNLRDSIMPLIIEELQNAVSSATTSEDPDEWDLGAVHGTARAVVPLPATMTTARWQGMEPDDIEEELLDLAERLYDEKERSIGPDAMRQLERAVMLRVVDNLWVRHLTDLDVLREGIGLRAFGQQDPLVAFKREAYEMYNQLLGSIQHDIVHAIYHAQLVAMPQPRPMRAVHPSSSGDGGPRPARSKRAMGRNDPCRCGSGKKYKHCHMREDEASEQQAGGQAAQARETTSASGKKTPHGRSRRRRR